MNDLPRGMIAPPTLDGIHLEHAPSKATIRALELRSVTETAGGRLREQRPWWGEAALEQPGRLVPLRRVRHEIAVDYANLADSRVEDALAVPGPHLLTVWKPVVLSYRGNGQAREGWIPWRSALDVFGPPPGLAAAHLGAFPSVSIGGAPSPALVLEGEEYDGGTPEEGETFFLEGGQRFKLPVVPTAGEIVLVRVIPLFRVLDATDAPRQYDNRRLFTEPRQLLFRET